MEFILKIHNYENASTLQRFNASTRNALIISFVLMVSLVNIQAQNTFPNSGNVGINTTTPSAGLDVNTKMNVDSTATFKDSVRVQKRLVVDQDVKIKGNSVFTGDGKFKNELKVLGIGKFKDQLKVFGKANFKNKLVVDSTARFKDKLVINGLTKMNGDAKVFGDLKLKGLADPSVVGQRILTITPSGKIGIGPSGPIDPSKCSTALPWMYADGTPTDDDIALCPDFKSVTIGGSFNVNGLSHLSNTGIGTLPNTDNMLTLRAANKIANISLLTLLPFAPTTPRYSIQNKVNQDDIIAYSVTNSNTGIDNFVVMGDGRVGIGTNNPITSIDVNGQITMRTGAIAGYLPIADANGTMTWTDPTSITTSSLWQSNAPDIYFNNGNVGIGTNNPQDRLQVGDTETRLIVGKANGQDLGWGTSYIGFNAARNGNIWSTNDDKKHNGGSVIYGDIFGSIIFSTIPTEPAIVSGGQSDIADATIKANTRLFIHKDGNVGIGTTAVSGAKLSVEGTIRARRVLVNLYSWADYVFEKDYTLLSLKELEKYISTNKHLPNMPTAEEVEKEGADLGEMNRVLVEKVEELTLYIIELNKRMEKMEADNKVLNAK